MNPDDNNYTTIQATQVDPSKPYTIQKFVDQLPIPSILKPTGKENNIPDYTIIMKQVMQQLHRDFPKTPLYTYAGAYPGPTIETRTNEPIRVKWVNAIPVSPHLLPVDTTIHGAEIDSPSVRTVVHVHGAHVPPESDGYPEAWFTNGFNEVGPFFTNEIYYYPNTQAASTLWYHDHALGITRLNVYAGLAGFYIIRDEFEDKLALPKGKYEIPIVIQDKSFNSDGSLFYPSQPDQPIPGLNPSIVPEFFGDTIVVNGKIWPYLEVEPRKYRFRILNGSNSRFFNLKFDLPLTITQIGTDGGFLEKPIPLTEIILAPAERADVIVDFSSYKDESLILINDASTPFPEGDDPDPDTTGTIMQFRVTLPMSGKDDTKVPDSLRSIEKLDPSKARKTRNLTLIESTDDYGRPKLLLNSMAWDEPITEKPQVNSIEVWQLINLTVDVHPIHLHLVQFQILDRQVFDVEHYIETGKLIFIAPPDFPELNEANWKDTVKAYPGTVTRVIARFDDFTGIYPWHCHILEHEDHEMMRPFKVIKKPAK